MSQQEAQDNAARGRIVAHMNKDHHDSVQEPYTSLNEMDN